MTAAGRARSLVRPVLTSLAALVGAVPLFLLSVLGFAVGGTLAWALGAVAAVGAVAGLTVALVVLGLRALAFLAVLPALLVAVAGADALPATYLRHAGDPQVVTVVSRVCERSKDRESCVYHYRVREADGTVDRMSPPGGDDYVRGESVEVYLDPRGVLGARPADGMPGSANRAILLYSLAALGLLWLVGVALRWRSVTTRPPPAPYRHAAPRRHHHGG